MKTYSELESFSKLAAICRRTGKLFPMAHPGQRTQRLVRQTLGFSLPREVPARVRMERRWRQDGIEGEELSWDVGYGPRTRAWLLKPAGWRGPLPGVLALHDHGGFKYYGKEKIADGPTRTTKAILAFRQGAYGGRAFANELARRGFAVLVNDVFMWGSRRFSLTAMAPFVRLVGQTFDRRFRKRGSYLRLYDWCAVYHENILAKYCSLLGTTLAGIVAYEDRVAVNYLRTRRDICTGQIGCVGLSGGGLRAALLQATCPRLSAAVVVGMMSTSEELLDHNVTGHTWMFFPAGWSRQGDWTDLVSCRAPSPLLVQYDWEDAHFTRRGMQNADRRIRRHYRQAGAGPNYRGEFYPGPHKFDVAMQEAAFAWLARHLEK